MVEDGVAGRDGEEWMLKASGHRPPLQLGPSLSSLLQGDAPASWRESLSRRWKGWPWGWERQSAKCPGCAKPTRPNHPRSSAVSVPGPLGEGVKVMTQQPPCAARSLGWCAGCSSACYQK